MRHAVAGWLALALSLMHADAHATGFMGLGFLVSDENNDSLAADVSGDGSVVVGSATTSTGFEAFRWTSSSGAMQSLGVLPGSTESEAHGVSADGRGGEEPLLRG